MKRYALFLLLFTACNSSHETTTTRIQERAARVVEYTPAPGQFINEPLSGFKDVNTPDDACRYAEGRMAKGDYVSLGGWGGYIVVAFSTPVPADDEYEIYIAGNAMPTSSEPGVVWVMEDTNGDGVANDTWYELRGGEYARSTRNYSVTYTSNVVTDNQPITWTDNQGSSGEIKRIGEHTQPNYFPLWIKRSEATYHGTLLPTNIDEETVEGSNAWIAKPLSWGYVDNYSSIDAKGTTNFFRIANAVDATGAAVNLRQVHFIKVQTGVNAWRTRIGEISTEVCTIGCFRTIVTEQ